MKRLSWRAVDGERYRTDPTISPYAWLYRIVLDTLIEAWRRESRSVRDHRRDLPWPAESSVQLALHLVDPATGPSTALARDELLERVKRTVEDLGENDHEILWMRHYDQLSFKEAAAVLGISENAATVRYARALKRLRDKWLQTASEIRTNERIESRRPEDADEVLVRFLAELEHAAEPEQVIGAFCARYPDRACELRDMVELRHILDRSATDVDPDIPARLGDFRIVRQIDHGGMGVVCEAIQEPLDRRVVVKIIRHGRTSPESRERFLREQRVLAKLHQTHIVPVFAAGEEGLHPVLCHALY